MELEKLKTELLKTLEEFSKASREFNSKKGNRAFDKITKLYVLLKQNYIEDVPDILIEWTKNDDEYIVLHGATFLLEFNPILAIEILKKLMLNDVSMAGFNAKYTLLEWEKGSLKLPPYE
jgi:predicted nucleotide-binding protein (sugar kinase/HSP70/actin superfamily)